LARNVIEASRLAPSDFTIIANTLKISTEGYAKQRFFLFCGGCCSKKSKLLLSLKYATMAVEEVLRINVRSFAKEN
jgi:hypothetical protein